MCPRPVAPLCGAVVLLRWRSGCLRWQLGPFARVCFGLRGLAGLWRVVWPSDLPRLVVAPLEKVSCGVCVVLGVVLLVGVWCAGSLRVDTLVV